jgi:hypothetical protein
MLAIVACYFNPIEHDALLANYHKFREALKGDLHTIELSFDGEFVIPDARHVKGATAMWHKERLLNVLIQELHPKYDKIAWVDADILFSEPDWVEQAEKSLEKHNIVQLFEHVDSLPGVIHAQSDNPFEYEPGKAWATPRKLLKNGLLDRFVMGGAEHMMFYALRGMFKNPMMNRFNLEWRRSYLKWAAQFYKAMQNNVGCIPGEITHLEHGTYSDPDFAERWMILSHNRFNPEIDIAVNGTNNSWSWSTDKPDLHRQVAEYFEDRKEDEQWISKFR